MIVLGLDPGTEQSAVVAYDGTRVVSHAIMSNAGMLAALIAWDDGVRTVLATEYMESSLGMAVGKETCRTIFWNGRFVQAWQPRRYAEVTRSKVKNHICGQTRVTDANIRAALLDRFGGALAAIGKKKTPGPLYGVKSHEWAALACAVTYYDEHAHLPEEIRPGVRAEF